jgi:Domain of unknown function (DUF4062)
VEAKHQVFVSSTFMDLQNERQAVMNAILSMGDIPVGMELFQAADETQWSYIKRIIKECDYYIVIIAERYGSVDRNGKSFTQLEYQYAIGCGVPIAVFPLDDSLRAAWRSRNGEGDRKQKIDDFRELVGRHIYKAWSNEHDLARYVHDALASLKKTKHRAGWIRADSVKFKELERAREDEGKLASSHLVSAVDLDLSSAGYFRKKQVFEISCDSKYELCKVSLCFRSEIVPLRLGAKILAPNIQPPKALDGSPLAELVRNEYFIDEVAVEKWRDIDPPADDKAIVDMLIVEYQVKDKNLRQLSDDHYWLSPVLNYTFLFNNSGALRLEVGKIISGPGNLEKLPRRTNERGLQEFTSRSAAFTAQGILWTLSRTD